MICQSCIMNNFRIFAVNMGFKVVHIEETDSTNRWLRDNGHMVEANSPGAVVVVAAEHQTAGKGCGTNSWESVRGKNLTFSMMIHPEQIPISRQWQISETVSVALCETLDAYLPDRRVEIKWPNDIYYGDGKLCGILIENRLQGGVIRDSIIGIGLNVNQEVFLSDAPNPVSLRQILGRDTDREELLRAFLDSFQTASMRETCGRAYRSRLFRKGKEAVYRDEKGRFSATLVDVASDGHLILRDTDGKRRVYAFKQVQFVV